ncbi:MAG: RagB/SusD family nutrient uptake outer membrane protein [Prolixibacteraceae bacterium]|nr:RagB/SusD family nutrient uptake outer membrane protein [Prolixibacteraceae bacterium]
MKIIKLKKYLIGLAMVSFLVTSCENDFLDIQNENSITEETYFTKAEHAYASMIGSYSKIKSWELYGAAYLRVWNSYSDLGKFHEDPYSTLMDLSKGAQRGDISGFYQGLYIGLYRANKTLQKLDPEQNPEMDISEDLRNEYTQECLTLRAYYNFMLTVFFNEPPLLLKPYEDPTYDFTNNTREEFYTAIIADLKNAVGEGDKFSKAYLPIERSSDQIGRITQGTALALLGKAYLYKASHAPAGNRSEDYTNAKTYLKKVVNLGVYSLIQPKAPEHKEYVYAFLSNFTDKTLSNYPSGDNNSESIFEAQFGENGPGTDGWESGSHADGHLLNPWYSAAGGWHAIGPTQKFADFFQDGDPRYSGTLYDDGDSIIMADGSIEMYSTEPGKHSAKNGVGIGWKKYFFPQGPTDNKSYGTNNIKIIRYSDVLLIVKFHKVVYDNLFLN